MELIELLTTAQKELMLSKSFYALPDNPSDKHFSAGQVKRKGYEPLIVLFDLINQLITAINTNITSENLRIADVLTAIGTLQGYFTDGKANEAIADKNGSDITTTYETVSNFNIVINDIQTQLANMATGTFDITQSTFALAKSLQINICETYFPSISVTSGTYLGMNAKIIKKVETDNSTRKMTEDEAKEYMKHMTGYSYLPRWDFAEPKYSYIVLPTGTVYMAFYDDTDGMILIDTESAKGFGFVFTKGTQTISGDKIFTNPVSVGTPISNSHATTKKYVDNLTQNVRNIAEGKNKAMVLSYGDTIASVKAKITENNAIGFKAWDTMSSGWVDKKTELMNGDYDSYTIKNSEFNSSSDDFYLSPTTYLIFRDVASMSSGSSYYLIMAGYFFTSISRTGDVVFVTETDVPDRWADVNNFKFYKMETTKVDLTNYLKNNETALPTTANTYDLGSSTYTWKDLYLGGDLHLPSLSSVYSDIYLTVQFYSGQTVCHGTVRPNADNARDLGSSGFYWKDIYYKGYLTSSSASATYRLFTDGAWFDIKQGNNIIYQFYDTIFKPYTNNYADLGTNSQKWKNLFLSHGINPNSSGYGLVPPTTTSWTADRTIATTTDLAPMQRVYTVSLDDLTIDEDTGVAYVSSADGIQALERGDTVIIPAEIMYVLRGASVRVCLKYCGTYVASANKTTITYDTDIADDGINFFSFTKDTTDASYPNYYSIYVDYPDLLVAHSLVTNTLKCMTVITQAQYDALVSGNQTDSDTFYFVEEE